MTALIGWIIGLVVALVAAFATGRSKGKAAVQPELDAAKAQAAQSAASIDTAKRVQDATAAVTDRDAAIAVLRAHNASRQPKP